MFQAMRGTLAVQAMIDGACTPEEVEAYVARQIKDLEKLQAADEDDRRCGEFVGIFPHSLPSGTKVTITIGLEDEREPAD